MHKSSLGKRLPRPGEAFIRKHDFHALLASTGLCQRQGNGKGGAVFAAALHGHAAAVQYGDFPHKGKPKPHAAHLPAAGLIHPEEGLEDTAPARG